MTMHTLDPKLRQHLIAQAEEAFEKSYSPYSQFAVGAALLTQEGEIFTGCNIENVSFGLTSCAERNAIFSGISKQGKISIKAIAVANKKGIACTPCGACRQVIAEFGPEAIVIHQGVKGGYVDTSLRQLLPAAFEDF